MATKIRAAKRGPTTFSSRKKRTSGVLLGGLCLFLFSYARSQTPHAQTLVAPVPPLGELHTRLDTLETQYTAGAIPHDPQNLALLRLKLEQAQLWVKEIGRLQGIIDGPATPGEKVAPTPAPTPGAVPISPKATPTPKPEVVLSNSQRSLDAALTVAESAAQSTGDAAPISATGTCERAYISPVDNSPQLYHVVLPDNYDPSLHYPLLVFLHGYAVDISKIAPKLPGSETWEPENGGNFLIAEPYGRGNTDFMDIGEEDVLTVLHEVERLYSVDERRVFLIGASMGGYGTYTVALRHPDIWTGIAPICGQADWYLWLKQDRKKVPAWQRVLNDADDPRHMEINALNIPVFVQHGSKDLTVDVEHSRRMVRDLRALHYSVAYHEYPGEGHDFTRNPGVTGSAVNWLSHLPPRNLAPTHVLFTTGNLRRHTDSWVDVQGLYDYSRMGRIEARADMGNRITVTTANVTRFTLTPAPAVFGANARAGMPLYLVVNGVPLKGNFSIGQPIYWSNEPVQNAIDSVPPLPQKSPQRCGPITNCYCDPMLLVYGTQGVAPEAPNPDKVAAERFRDEWQRFADGVLPIKADSEITPDDRSHFNMVLFGTSQSNSLLQAAARQLPLELTSGGYRLGDKEVSGSHLGLQFCYPSPWSHERMIVVQSGLFWGTGLPYNHKFDLLPDYIIYNGQIEADSKTNHALKAGFFDDYWQMTTGNCPMPN